MKAFVGLFFILAVLAAGYMMAAYSRRDRLPRNDRKELINARNLIDELHASSAEHSALGDSYATIVFDEIRKHKKGLQ